ncbi:GumC family protein [Aurantiacibacter aquimixticola]|uniref:non-specific protein-tyrosine kinase n=1 Tax=Aurantiacibacter aquimixticola TaxID=1958945 RepID=A0A419RUK7_9SPHN|nr:polysaccharide biosynthesis tyrosine autokinase [Aurantiacibacter aquimixticola]RJY09462.1 polysaccharide biosynthesis tyrosine autokinase [Aurantiacibacter aquimixticola]
MNDYPLMHGPGSNRRNWVDAYVLDGEAAQGPTQPKLIDIATIRGILFRQRWLIAMTIALAVLAGLVFTILATPMYEARSTVRVEPFGAFIIEGQNLDQGIASNQVYDFMSTQVGIIESRSLARLIAEDHNLGARDDFIGEDIEERRPADLSDSAWRDSKTDIAVAMLHDRVSAEVPANNWIIEIAFRSEDPAIAAEMANAYATAFAASETREAVEGNEYARDYLREQIAVIRQRLRDAENAANGYARTNGIVVQPIASEDGQSETTLTSANLANINARAAAARAARIAAEQRWRAVQNTPAGQLAEVQQSTYVQSLRADRVAKETELVALRQRYNDNFPQVADLRAQIAAVDERVDAAMNDIKMSIRNEYLVARNQESALAEELRTATGETLLEQDRQVEYGVLEREAQALREQLQALLARFNQLSATTNIDGGQLNLLDTAVVPSAPYAPSLSGNLLLAMVFGIALAGVLAVLREMLDDRIRSITDIEERLGLPLLGHTPFVAEQDIDYEGRERYGELVEAYASIRSTIDFSLPRDRNVIQLTSSQEAEGKSTTAIILAELFASLGRKVLLVDADLRRPSIASLVGTKRPKTGLVEVLLGHADLSSAVIRGVHENLEILSVGEVPPNPTELLGSSQLAEFIARYRQQYSLIIFDSPPILGLADAPTLSRMVDGTAFVMEANRTRFGQVRSAIRRLRVNGGNPIGGILTKYRALNAGEKYNSQYNYYRYVSETETA